MIGLLLGAVLGAFLTVVGTPLFIRLLHKRGYGQIIRDDGPTSHATKRGTPTMGGVVIVLNFVVVYFVTHWIMTMLELENSGIAEISSKSIGEKVMDRLIKINKVAYIRFASVYKDFKEVRDFEEFVSKINS